MGGRKNIIKFLNMENKSGFIFFLFGVVALIGFAMFFKSQSQLGVYAGDSFNNIERVTLTASSTNNRLPLIVMTTNTNRIYGLIQNDSDTAMYVYFGGFESGIAASTTVTPNKGIRLNANGGQYEIKPENLYTGPVFVTSSAAGKTVLTTEK